MATMLKAAMGAILALGVVGCASTGASGMPCSSCKYGVSDQKASPPKHYCVIEGKTVDCRTSPAGCPECAKH